MSQEKILIVDDEKLILVTSRLVLESGGYKVLTAETGDDCLGIAERERPDVILLDIMMPGCDGWETLSRIRANPKIADTPVIIFTAREHSRGRHLAREMGATDYFQKPFDPEDLIEAIRSATNSETVPTEDSGWAGC